MTPAPFTFTLYVHPKSRAAAEKVARAVFVESRREAAVTNALHCFGEIRKCILPSSQSAASLRAVMPLVRRAAISSSPRADRFAAVVITTSAFCGGRPNPDA